MTGNKNYQSWGEGGSVTFTVPQIWKRTRKGVELGVHSTRIQVLSYTRVLGGWGSSRNKAKTPLLARVRQEIDIHSLNAFKKYRERHGMLAADK